MDRRSSYRKLLQSISGLELKTSILGFGVLVSLRAFVCAGEGVVPLSSLVVKCHRCDRELWARAALRGLRGNPGPHALKENRSAPAIVGLFGFCCFVGVRLACRTQPEQTRLDSGFEGGV